MVAGNQHGAVIVGVDGSESGLHAVRWAAREAAGRHAPLRLVTALGCRADYGYGPRLGWSDVYKAVTEHARRYLTAACTVALTVHPDLELRVRMRLGRPAPVLVEESEGAALLVVGHQGWGLPGGSVAVRVAATAPCPVVVVSDLARLETSSGNSQVVVGVDGSELSEAAIGFAFEEADRRRVPLVAVHCWLDRAFDPDVAAAIDWDGARVEEEALLAQRLAGWCGKYPDVVVRCVVRRERPAHTLIEHAALGALLVVGSRGRGEVLGCCLGSVSQTVIGNARCPVAVVRPQPEHDGRR